MWKKKCHEHTSKLGLCPIVKIEICDFLSYQNCDFLSVYLSKEAHGSAVISVINKQMTTHDHTFTVYFVSIVLPEIIMSHSSIVFHNHRFYKAKKIKKKIRILMKHAYLNLIIFFKYNCKSYWWPFSFLAHLNSFACSTVNKKNHL
jgi:hypothetical protein